MKIVHISLCGQVTDNWTYQDNILPKFHKKLGFEVSIITSKFIWTEDGKIVTDSRSSYINENNICVTRLPSRFKTNNKSKIKLFKNVQDQLIYEKPNILFIHGVQFLDMLAIIKYVKNNPEVKVFVDNHADYSNSATNWLSKKVLHKFLWKYMAQSILPYTTFFYGVLPARVEFLIDMYSLPAKKVKLLLMGADDEEVTRTEREGCRQYIRNKYSVSQNDFLIVTGGKIDKAKFQTLTLIKAVHELKIDNLKLIIFGSIEENIRKEFEELIKKHNVIYIGWVKGNKSYDVFSAADLVVFPGRHSVYWEQVAGLGIPMLVKYWEGTEHVNVGGNCEFIYSDDLEVLKRKLQSIILDTDKYKNMLNVSRNKGKDIFSYQAIAERSIKIQ